jgi:hypothetical protein
MVAVQAVAVAQALDKLEVEVVLADTQVRVVLAELAVVYLLNVQVKMASAAAPEGVQADLTTSAHKRSPVVAAAELN